ncbi:MAG: bifunctional riboflavin kinase/FAD synthetase [Tatlockia sp.]|nr:bifunctional riboflavin kinase/FAD synthetase [Tatlockia sp.]
MKLLSRLTDFSNFLNGSVATIGNFDGIHLGHQALLKNLRLEADRLQLPMIVILFEPQPAEFFRPAQAPPRLTSLREKLTLLKHCKVDYVYCLNFDYELALMSAENFAEKYFFSLLTCRYLLIGQDFRFGQGRCGDVEFLKKLAAKANCRVESFSDFSLLNKRVSSTQIRTALEQGELEQATQLLGRTYSICGRVIKGDGRGRQWGIPTANLAMRRLTLPLKGVFCVKVNRGEGKLLDGVANLGSRPTVDGSKNTLEINLFDFDEDLYGRMVEVYFFHKLRDEIKFSSVEALIVQIHEDISAAKSEFRKRRFILTSLVETYN